jgi:hypothetical protein
MILYHMTILHFNNQYVRFTLNIYVNLSGPYLGHKQLAPLIHCLIHSLKNKHWKGNPKPLH